MRLYNTLTRRKEEIKPMRPPRVGVYTCGPTVYNYQHVGNYRTYIFEDILVRTLGLAGYEVQREMNVTDVGHLTSQADEGEDKMEVGSAREGKSAWEIARFYTESFVSDCGELNILLPRQLRRATDHIQEQIELVRRLERKGMLYRACDGLYFDTSRFPAYDRLAGKEHVAGIQAGARVDAKAEKKHPADFAVWKFSPPDRRRQMEWDSPWGKGFPGWHIECSAMAMKYLGESFDIHCGGVDHIPIHHTNEIAQAEAATGQPFVKLWMHGEFLLMNSAKMAKSEGGFVTLGEVKRRGFDPLDYRYHCLTAHYRKQLDFTWEALEAARVARRRLQAAAAALGQESAPPRAEDERAFREALFDDLNVPLALGVAHDCLRAACSPAAKRGLLERAEAILAVGLLAQERELEPPLRELLKRREEARRNKDFALSDDLRRRLDEAGVLVEDTKTGQKWRRK
ncbi:MAG: cysteine--tRNA ligase [Elusimicrobia bacterium]|nr:cysteine--tRNA ligase [Elusimicrobiota bacterium]MDE2424572.1 cysteine--tRNA ligase [Elusimicrobiota bacterium]